MSAERPELLGLMNLEGRESSERLTYLYDYYVEPLTAPIGRLLEHLAAEGRIRPVSGRTMHFLVAHGAAAPFTLQALARELDPADPLDPAVRDEHIDLVTEVLLAGLRLDGGRRLTSGRGGATAHGSGSTANAPQTNDDQVVEAGEADGLDELVGAPVRVELGPQRVADGAAVVQLVGEAHEQRLALGEGGVAASPRQVARSQSSPRPRPGAKAAACTPHS